MIRLVKISCVPVPFRPHIALVLQALPALASPLGKACPELNNETSWRSLTVVLWKLVFWCVFAKVNIFLSLSNDFAYYRGP